MISRQHFNVMVPMDSSEPADSNPNFIRGKHHFNQTCFWHVIDFILVPSNQTTYSAALKLDAKVRGWRLPSAMVIASLPLSDEENTIKNFQEGLSLIFKEIVLLCLHRYIHLWLKVYVLTLNSEHILPVQYWSPHSTLSGAPSPVVSSLRMEVHVRLSLVFEHCTLGNPS